jgi:hypothetical protein
MGKEMEAEDWKKDTTNWFADEGWEDMGDGVYFLTGNEDGFWFQYRDVEQIDETSSMVELELNRGLYNASYILQQETIDGTVKHRLIVPPFKDYYCNSMDNYCGVVYGNDGRMEKIRNVKGLPKRIDMDKTIELFLKQVAEKRFDIPVLVKVGE